MKLSVIRFDFHLDKAFDAMLRQQPSIALKVCRQSDTDAINLEHFQRAHVYQILAARDEVPPQWHVTGALLDQCPNLICISTSGAGYDTVDVDECNRRGVLVVNQSGCNSDSVCEHTFGLILSLKHRIAESDKVLRAGTATVREDLMGNEIKGLTLGIVGLGNVGRRVAFVAKVFGMKVIAYDPHIESHEFERRHALSSPLNELMAQSDVVTVHCPRTKETLNMFNDATFSPMKTGAIFISTARGGIHDEVALLNALNNKKLSGAGLDVWAVEPPSKENALLQLPNVIATYHTAGVTHEARRNAATMGAEQIISIANGELAPRIVNPEVLPEFQRKLKILNIS